MGKGRRKDKTELTWRFHPLAESPKLAAFSLAFVFLCSYGAVKYIGSLTFSLPIVAFFLYSLRSLFLPTDHRLTADEVVIETPFGTTKKPWSSFGGYVITPRSILLTRLARPSFLDRFSGIDLRLRKKEREEIIDFVKARIKG